MLSSTVKKPFSLLVVLSLTASAAVACTSKQEFVVSQVVSGDLVEIKSGENTHLIRLEGLAVPQADKDCLADESKRHLESLLPVGAMVETARDVTEPDSNGLTAIKSDGSDVAVSMLEQGFAVVAPLNGFQASDEYTRAQEGAKESARGVHGAEDSCLLPTQKGKDALVKSQDLEEELAAVEIEDPWRSEESAQLVHQWGLSNQAMLESVLEGGPNFQFLWGERANELVVGHTERQVAASTVVAESAAEFKRQQAEAAESAERERLLREERKREYEQRQREAEHKDHRLDIILTVLNVLTTFGGFSGLLGKSAGALGQLLFKLKVKDAVSMVPGVSTLFG